MKLLLTGSILSLIGIWIMKGSTGLRALVGIVIMIVGLRLIFVGREKNKRRS